MTTSTTYNNYFIFKNEFFFFIPEIIFILFIIVLLFFAIITLFYDTMSSFNFFNFFFYILLVFYFFEFYLLFNGISSDYSLFSFSYVSNSYLLLIRIFFLLIVILFWILLKIYSNLVYLFNFELLFLISGSILGLYLMFLSYDFINLYLSLELYSLCAYAFIGCFKKNLLFIESAFKYFVIGSLSSSFFLFSVCCIYSMFGTFNFYDLEILLYYNKFFFYDEFFSTILLNFFFVVLVVSFFIKIGAAPFHFWSIDIYDGSPLIATIFLIIVSKFSFLAFISHFFIFVFAGIDYIWKAIIFIVFVSSILIGSVGSVFQTKLKRIFIYSSISNLSLIVSFIYINTFYSTVFFFLTLIIYSVSMFGLFSIFLFFYSNNGFCLRRLNSLINFFFLNKCASFCFSIIILSLAGMPPFIGFITKFINIFVLSEFNYIHFIFLIFILFSTVFTIFYYLRLVKIMFVNNFKNFIFILPLNFYLAFIISFIALFLCISFFYMDFFINFISFFVEETFIY